MRGGVLRASFETRDPPIAPMDLHHIISATRVNRFVSPRGAGHPVVLLQQPEKLIIVDAGRDKFG